MNSVKKTSFIESIHILDSLDVKDERYMEHLLNIENMIRYIRNFSVIPKEQNNIEEWENILSNSSSFSTKDYFSISVERDIKQLNNISKNKMSELKRLFKEKITSFIAGKGGNYSRSLRCLTKDDCKIIYAFSLAHNEIYPVAVIAPFFVNNEIKNVLFLMTGNQNLIFVCNENDIYYSLTRESDSRREDFSCFYDVYVGVISSNINFNGFVKDENQGYINIKLKQNGYNCVYEVNSNDEEIFFGFSSNTLDYKTVGFINDKEKSYLLSHYFNDMFSVNKMIVNNQILDYFSIVIEDKLNTRKSNLALYDLSDKHKLDDCIGIVEINLSY